MNRSYQRGKVLLSMSLAVWGAALTSGCGGGEGDLVAETQGAWIVYTDGFPEGVTENPAKSITGSAKAWYNGAETTITLDVAGLPPNQQLGSHLHKLACVTEKAGGHYQHMPAPTETEVATPTYANITNEVWLDFPTDASGVGTTTVKVGWEVRKGEANAIIVHEKVTDINGKAGARYACIAMPF
jgi:Cu/Zn superoxide dismutase